MIRRINKQQASSPISPYDKNLSTDVSASPVIGPVVSSERITARNGVRNSLGVTSSKSDNKKDTSLHTA